MKTKEGCYYRDLYPKCPLNSSMRMNEITVCGPNLKYAGVQPLKNPLNPST
jgi:hypothetical protein